MTFNIGMIGASGSGKTSLMTAMFTDMKERLLANRQTTKLVRIRYEDKQTQLAIKDSKQRFESCIRLEKFIAWERSAECGTFGFNIEFGIGDKSKTFNFKIMDYPGGMLSDRDEFNRVCMPHIAKSCALFVPIDAVALMKYEEEERVGSSNASRMLERFELERVFEIVKIWAAAHKEGHDGLIFLVPIKTESYFSDNGCSECDQGDRLFALIQRVYVNRVKALCGASSIRVVYDPVDTYGCVAVNSVEWTNDPPTLKEEFSVLKNRGLSIRGGVDLFSVIVKTALEAQRKKSAQQAEKGKEEINNRGAIKKFYYYFFPDLVKQSVEANDEATKFYEEALNAMMSFSSTKRLRTI